MTAAYKIAVLNVMLALCACVGIKNESLSDATVPAEEIPAKTIANPKLRDFVSPYVNYGYFSEDNVRRLLGTPLKERQNADETQLTYPYFSPVRNERVLWLIWPLFTQTNQNPEYSLTFRNDRLQTLTYSQKSTISAGWIIILPLAAFKKQDLYPYTTASIFHCSGLADKIDITFNNISHSRAVNRLESCLFNPLLGLKSFKRSLGERDKKDEKTLRKKDTADILEYNPDIISFTREQALASARREINKEYAIIAEDAFNTEILNCRIFRLKADSTIELSDKASALCFIKNHNGLLSLSVESDQTDTAATQLQEMLRTVRLRK